jgi:hypothetical protein
VRNHAGAGKQFDGVAVELVGDIAVGQLCPRERRRTTAADALTARPLRCPAARRRPPPPVRPHPGSACEPRAPAAPGPRPDRRRPPAATAALPAAKRAAASILVRDAARNAEAIGHREPAREIQHAQFP